MPLKAETLQRQLEVAQKERSAVESKLDGQEPKTQPMWRRANAKVASLEKRLEKAQSRSSSQDSTDE